jgi:putative transposase
MAQMGLAGRAPPHTPRTTESDHGFPHFPNRVAGLRVDHPDQVGVANVTYVRLRHEFVYLAVIRDGFTRRVRRWVRSRSLDGALTLAALKRALRAGMPWIPHSDQGGSTRRPNTWRGYGGGWRCAWRRWGARRRTATRNAEADHHGGGGR